MTGFLVLAGLVLLGILLLILLSGVRAIPNTRIGIVEKRFSPKGSVKSGFIALNGEAGFQPNVLRGGLHYLTPIQYVVPRVVVGGNQEKGSSNKAILWKLCLPCCSPIVSVRSQIMGKVSARRKPRDYGQIFAIAWRERKSKAKRRSQGRLSFRIKTG